MALSILIGCLTIKYETLFSSWHFFNMAANESRLTFYTIAKINKLRKIALVYKEYKQTLMLNYILR